MLLLINNNNNYYYCSVVKNLHANAGDTGDVGSVPGSGRYPAGGNGNPLQYQDRGAWWATVHGIAKIRTQLMTEHVGN